MIYPIIAYGHQILRKDTEEISVDYPGLKKLIADMYETMYNAHGVGLAAPQIGLSIRMFIVDGSPMEESDDPRAMDMEDFKKVFINPLVIEEDGNDWPFEEGCLSIPDIREDVYRPERVRIKYFDEDFVEREEIFEGLKARIIQHEYDHLEGVLFTDYVQGLKKQLLKSKLAKISKGKIDPPYPMKYPKKR